MHTAADALSVLGSIVDALPPSDGIRAFSRLYQAVTPDVRDALGTATFSNPTWLDRLDAEFANLYFRALKLYVEDSPNTPRAWYPLFTMRSEPRAAIQFALAGMNAHINRDLPVALVKACAGASIELSRGTPEYRDYLAVNPILASVEGRIKSEFLAGGLAVADHLLGRLDDVVANFSVVEARAGAWSHGEALWALRGSDLLGASFLDRSTVSSDSAAAGSWSQSRTSPSPIPRARSWAKACTPASPRRRRLSGTSQRAPEAAVGAAPDAASATASFSQVAAG